MGQQQHRPHTGAFPPRGRRFRRGSAWIVIVALALIGAGAYWYFFTMGGGNSPSGQPGLSALAEPVEEVGPRKLEVRFGSTVALRCDAQGGTKPYELDDPKFFRVEEEETTVHRFVWTDLPPGRFFYRVRVLRPGGKPLDGPLRNVLIPGEELATAATTTPSASAGGTTVTPGGSREGRSGTADPASGETTGEDDASAGEDVAADGSQGETAVPGAVGQELPASHLYDPPIREKPKTKSQRFALMAYDIGFRYGGASVTPAKRVELKKELDQRLGAFEAEKTPEAATEIGRNYLLLHNEMMALKYFGKAEQMKPGHVPALRGKLFIYEKYGMGWKVQETYGKLLALDPGSAALQKEAARARRMYGDFETFKETPKIITNPKFKDVARERLPK